MTAAEEAQFSDWLRVQLRSRRMSLRQLADRSGVNVSTVSRIVHGKRRPSLRTAIRLSRVLGPLATEGSPMLLVGTSRNGLDTVATVERALRADPRLSDAAIQRLMTLYHVLRTEPQPTVPVPLARRAGPSERHGQAG
jgi:transcriptional regulator with XRE-family HTH domain